MIPPRRSRPDAQVALAVAPPYYSNLWLGMGLPLLDGLLAEAGVRATLVQIADDVWHTPPALEAFATLRMLRPVSEAETAACLETADVDAWLQRAAQRLADGPERVFGLSVWRHNLAATLAIAKRLKVLRPDALIVLGGPHAVEEPESCQAPWLDVVIHGQAEALAAPVVQALLVGDFAPIQQWTGFWLHPRHGALQPTIAPPFAKPLPRIDYATLVPFIAQTAGLHKPHIPVLLNLGCPFHCSFCTNTTIYPQMQWRRPELVVAEVAEASRAWRACMGEHNRPQLAFCDATVNALPDEWDRLLDGVIATHPPEIRPQLYGCLIVDSRITPQRVAKFVEAGYCDGFFGLESASDSLRRQIKKPGRIEAVARGLQTLHDASGGQFRMGMGVIVGHPHETQALFDETVAFVDWAVNLGVVAELNVAPLIRSAAAMDAGLLGHAQGPSYGVQWRDDGPAGDPAERARRLDYLLDTMLHRVKVSTAGPRELVKATLVPPAHPPTAETTREPQPLPPALARIVAAYERLRAQPQQRVWSLLEIVPRDGSEANGLVATYRRPDGVHAAIVVRPRNDAAPAYRRVGSVDVSYLREFCGRSCAFDASLTEDVARILA